MNALGGWRYPCGVTTRNISARPLRRKTLSLARQSRAGLPNEVNGVPLALDRARQCFLTGCRNRDLDVVLTSAFLAHPGRALDHHIRRIAFLDIKPAHLIQIQRSNFTGRSAEASFALALGVLGRYDCLEHAFFW